MDRQNEELLDCLARSTRSPWGDYTSDHTWPLLEARLRSCRPRPLHRWLRRAAACAAVVLTFVLGWAMYSTVISPFLRDAAPVEAPASREPIREALVFNQEPLRQIVVVLRQTFGADIIIADESLKDYRITATFGADESLDGILDVLRRAAGLQVERRGGRIIIRRGGADEDQ